MTSISVAWNNSDIVCRPTKWLPSQKDNYTKEFAETSPQPLKYPVLEQKSPPENLEDAVKAKHLI